MMKPFRLAASFFLMMMYVSLSSTVFGQRGSVQFDHVEPPVWWVGMKHDSVQILFHHANHDIASYTVSLDYEGVTLREVRKVENPHYLFVTIRVDRTTKPGRVPITFSSGKRKFVYPYELKERNTATNRAQGFNSSDVIYLIMPDRFANGDPGNDVIPGMFEGVDRTKGGMRHGGDLKGITDRLDYIKDLGFTAIWLNSALENNQRKSSYHGYAITDLYNIDRRFGGNEAYLQFIDKCHEMGLKVIKDMVMNHIGNDHWLMHDPPEQDWVHQFPEFTRSNYQSDVISDPYRSESDSILMSNGWFDTTMPDVNQSNPLFANYLIQNTLWWIEYSGIDGIRMDTHPYPDKHFMARWAKAVLTEYPAFNIVGEVWLQNSIPATAYWQKGMRNKDGYDSNLPSVTDFPFCFTIPRALNEPTGWDTGLRKLYMLLAQDFLYPDANNNVTFLDNHDMTRFFRLVGNDLRKLKMGIAFLLTTRGIPQVYYGTEILMDGDGGHHPDVRKDFPGGWPGDPVNAFTREGRTDEQNEAFDYLKTLLNWRKDKEVIHRGKLTHYIPEDNIYVYFRHNENDRVMVIMNANSEEKTIDMKRFGRNLVGVKGARNVVTGAWISDLSRMTIPAMTADVFELE